MIAINDPTKIKELNTRGNVAIELFNMDGASNRRREDMLRFEWVKRLPFASYSHAEFMEQSNELIELTRKHQGLEPIVKVLGFSDPQDCLTLHSLSGGQDDETFNMVSDGRDSYSLDNFTEEDYKKNTEPKLVLTSEGKDYFEVCLTASAKTNTGLRGMGIIDRLMGEQFISGAPYKVSFSGNSKGRLKFYGQCLKPELFEAIVENYHKPGLTHSLSHPHTDDIKGWVKTLI